MGTIPNNTDARDKLEEEIKRLESVEGGTKKQKLPAVKMDEINYEAPSDESLRSSAENNLSDYRKEQTDAIKQNSETTAKELSDRKDAYIKSRDEDISALEGSYQNAVRAVDSDAIKRGIARSSVAAVARGELEKEYLSRNADISESYGKKISQLDSDIAALDGKLRTALNGFNLSYATRLNAEITRLKAERDDKIAAVTKYNNEVRAKQAQLDADRKKTESDLYSAALDQEKKEKSLDSLSSEERDKIYRSVYDQMDGFLSSLSPQEAKLEINNHSLYRQHLSNYYYYRLYDKYGR